MDEYHTDDNRKALPSREVREEIERAIDNARRTPWDKWFRRQWYRAGALNRRRYVQDSRGRDE